MSQTDRRVLVLVALLWSLTFTGTAETASQDNGPSTMRSTAREGQPRRAAEEQQEQRMRDRVRYLAESVVGSRPSEDPLESARIRADFAALLCAYGDRVRAREIFNQSRSVIVGHLLRESSNSQGDAASRDEFDVALRVSRLIATCDPGSQISIADETARIRLEKTANESSAEQGPAVVPDRTWGTRPSIPRELAAEMLCRAAYEKAAGGELDTAERFVDRSLDYSVSGSLSSILGRLEERGRKEAASSLLTKAIQRVKALPSGAEISALRFAVKMSVLEKATGALEAPGLDDAANRYLAGYLDAMSALLMGPDSALIATSGPLIGQVKEALPLYVRLRPAVRPAIEEWLARATGNPYSPIEAVGSAKPFQSISPEDDISKLESIAAGSVDESQRDSAYASIASTHLQWGKFDEAFGAISKISDQSLKREMLDLAAYRRISFGLARATDYRAAMQDAGKISSAALRIKLYIQAAKAATTRDVTLSDEYLGEAASLTTRMDPSLAQCHFLFSISTVYSRFDAVRAFEVLGDAVKSVNRLRDQLPTRWQQPLDVTVVELDPKWGFPRMAFDDPVEYKRAFDLTGLRSLVWKDFDGALLAVSSINDKLLRANALYEICAGVLGGRDRAKPASAVASTLK
jgi:hypothetical protein